jgi:hypothetical protein
MISDVATGRSPIVLRVQPTTTVLETHACPGQRTERLLEPRLLSVIGEIAALVYAIQQNPRRKISSCSEIFITLMESHEQPKGTGTMLAWLCICGAQKPDRSL